MPVRRDIQAELRHEDVLRRQGFPPGAKVRPEIERRLRAVLAEVEAEGLLEPTIAYRIHAIAHVDAMRVTLECGRVLEGRLSPALENADRLAALACTIGPRLEAEVRASFGAGESLRGLLLDGVGSAAADSLAEAACRMLATEAATGGTSIGGRISPGLPRMPMTQQAQVLELAGAGEIGIRLTAGGLMWPQKSASMVVGIGCDVPTWSRADVCRRCRLSRRCAYRIDGPAAAGAPLSELRR